MFSVSGEVSVVNEVLLNQGDIVIIEQGLMRGVLMSGSELEIPAGKPATLYVSTENVSSRSPSSDAHAASTRRPRPKNWLRFIMIPPKIQSHASRRIRRSKEVGPIFS